MQIAVADIKVKKRVRRDQGDIDRLAASLRDHGLMNPITINARRELIAGFRRLQAARLLGWDRIEALVVDAADELSMLALEMKENFHRRDFAAQELTEGLRRLERLRNPGFFKRLWLGLRRLFGGLLGHRA